MKAMRIHSYGGPEVVQREDIPVPSPAANEVLVKVMFAGINFMDIHTRQGKYENSRTYPMSLPITLGMEGAGIIQEVGAGVTRLRAGDRVAWCISWGSYAGFAVIPESRVAVLPPRVGFDLAAATLFPGSTAHYLVNDVARLSPGDTCLVHAAAGGIGQLLVQLAKRLGVTVFATTSSMEKTEIVRDLGADHVLSYGSGRFADRIRELTTGKGVDVVFDAVGRTTLRDSFRATRTRGLVVNYGSVAGSLEDLDPIELGEAGSLFLTRPRLADHLQDAETVQRRADDIFGGLLDGSISMKVSERFSFDEMAQAHDELESRRHIGKSILELHG